MKSSLFKISPALFLGLLALSATGCGKSSTSAQTVGATNQATCGGGAVLVNGTCSANPCQTGYYLSGGSCVLVSTGGDLFNNCSNRGGTQVVSNGVNLCKITGPVKYQNYDLNPYPYWYVLTTPRLTETSNNSAAETSIVLLAGDQVTFMGSGSYGTTSNSASSCDTPFEGKSSAGSKGSFRFGALIAKVGASESWQLTNGSTHLVGSAGPLRVGFNLDTNGNISQGCFNYYQWNMQVTRCFDNSGNPYPCS